MNQSARCILTQYVPDFPLRHCGRLLEDTTDFCNISYGDVIVLGDKHYLVLRDEAERRFGIEDPKFWVKRCRELETGERKILKLVFHETFDMKIGMFSIQCFRSPQKEARILELVHGDARFMQGVTVLDSKRNPVRVLDVVHGKQLDAIIEDMAIDHETYFHESLPGILEKFIEAVEAIRFLHVHREKHGDIRRDHLWVEYGTGIYRWIDFDYTFDFHENPFGLDLFGLGNILLFIVGKGEHSAVTLAQEHGDIWREKKLTSDDFSIMFMHRLANLKKIFDYIPDRLSNVLLHFSAGANIFYDTVEEFLDDLRPCLDLLK
ncbi:serine/threonine protein kinase [Desulfovibrio inopinatus]|uniref:serine/threonine protein kinase n=1 Tax=Desulfovibrio inopinatus TaxID=102109 RepID=UPI0004246107|nr:serine/threonine protein kinase [Desulfovibrio inopinatus]